jgi:transcriptional regulator with XRE-family HTH domain
MAAKNANQRQAPYEAEELSIRFGAAMRQKRKAMGMTQEDVALASGVSRRFVIELEAGRPTCELGRSLVVAAAIGFKSADALFIEPNQLPSLPDILDEDGKQ